MCTRPESDDVEPVLSDHLVQYCVETFEHADTCGRGHFALRHHAINNLFNRDSSGLSPWVRIMTYQYLETVRSATMTRGEWLGGGYGRPSLRAEQFCK